MNEITNWRFAQTDGQFQMSCARAGVQPTKRQASKWRNKRDRAWHARHATAAERSSALSMSGKS